MNDDFEDIVGEIEDELDLTLYADSQELVEEVTAQILLSIENGLLEKEEFHIVLTGGTLGVQISEFLKAAWNSAPEMYSGLHVWWSDERFVESESVERNAAPLHHSVTNSNIQIHEALALDSVALDSVALDSKTLDSQTLVKATTVEDAVNHYQSALDGVRIDLNILGLGPDGHVASLFPGIADLDDQRSIFAITDSPKPPAVRISFTMKMLNEAREVWIVAAGESKADAVAKIIEGDLSIPASYVSAVERTRLIVDQAAFFTE